MMVFDWSDGFERGYRAGAGDWFIYGAALGFAAALLCGLLAAWIVGAI